MKGLFLQPIGDNFDALPDTAQEKIMILEEILGIKSHLTVDLQGLPQAIHITTANITDRSEALKR